MIRTKPKAEAIDANPSPPKPIMIPVTITRETDTSKPITTMVTMVSARKGRPNTGKAKVPITLRLDQTIVDALKQRGPEWRIFAENALRNALNLTDP